MIVRRRKTCFQIERGALPARSRLVGQGDVVDEAARLADLGHDVVAGVDAERAGDAFQLLAVADVDAHRADVDAGVAVDAVAQILAVLALAAGSPRHSR
jgi:hypothetical protein